MWGLYENSFSFLTMRVLHILPSFGVGGAEQLAGHLMMGLAGYVEIGGVSLFAAANSPIEEKLLNRRLPLWHLGKHPGFDARMYPRLDRVLREFQPHVLHTHMSVLRYVLPVALRRRVGAVIHTLHSLAQHETDAFGLMLNRVAFRKTVLAVSISHQVAESYRRFYGLAPQALVLNGIPVEEYRSDKRDRARWRMQEGFGAGDILFTSVGRLESVKNPFLPLEAFAALADSRSHLVFLGAGDLRAPLLDFIRSRGLQHRIHLLGKRHDVADCLAASDVFVMGSNWEGNPLSVMEAMAAGLPVIATAVGGIPELVDNQRTGILIPSGDRTAMTAAMARLIAQPEQRAAMGQAASARAIASFGFDKMAQGYLHVYRQALSKNPAGSYAAKPNLEVNSCE